MIAIATPRNRSMVVPAAMSYEFRPWRVGTL